MFYIYFCKIIFYKKELRYRLSIYQFKVIWIVSGRVEMDIEVFSWRGYFLECYFR